MYKVYFNSLISGIVKRRDNIYLIYDMELKDMNIDNVRIEDSIFNKNVVIDFRVKSKKLRYDYKKDIVERRY